MPFTGAYSITQGNDPSSFVLADTSDYTDEPQNTFSGRRIFLYKTDGTTLVPDGTTTTYIDFPYSMGDQIAIDVLDQDYSLDILVEWISLAPQPGSVYTLEVIYTFLGYSKEFRNSLCQYLSGDPNLDRDLQYWFQVMKLQALITGAESANQYQQQTNAQRQIEMIKDMIDNQNFYF